MPIKKLTKQFSTKNPFIRSVREKKQHRMIVIGFIITAVLVVGFSGYALVYEFLIKNRIPVARVNSVVIDNTYFQERVRLERYAYIQQYQALTAQYQFFADDPTASQFVINQQMQMRQILDNYEFFGESVLNSIINEELVAQQAASLGVGISEEEIQRSIQQFFSYFPDGTPTPQPIPTTVPTPTLSRTQEALLNPRSISLFEPEVSEPRELQTEGTESVTVDEADKEEEAADSIIATPTSPAPQPTGTPSPTATPYTEAMFQENYRRYISDIDLVGVSEDSLRKYIYNFLLNQKVREEIVKDAPREVEQVWARHILVESEENALDVLARLEEGEDWSAIAAEISLDTSNKDIGGDLGWFPGGKMVPAFEDAAFNMQIGEISRPVETPFGWHIIQLIGSDILPLSSVDFQNAQETYFQEWIAQIRAEADIEINDVWRDLVPTQPVLPF